MSGPDRTEYRQDPEVAVEVLEGEALIWDERAQAFHA